MKMFKMLAALVFALLMTGCATVPMGDAGQDAALKTFPAPRPGTAGIYIYRNETFGAAIKQVLDIDGMTLGQSAAKTYFYTEVAPGRHTITSRAENTDTVEINAVAGKLYFVWQEIKMGLVQARTKLNLVNDAEGKKGVRESQLAASSLTPAAAGAAPGPAAATRPQAAPPARSAVPGPAGPYAGQWSGNYRCGEFVGNWRISTSPAPWTRRVSMVVEGNHATMTRGDANFTETLQGEIAPDGSLALAGQGAMANDQGRPWSAEFQGRFSANPARFDGTGAQKGINGVVSRNCTVDLVRGAGGR